MKAADVDAKRSSFCELADTFMREGDEEMRQARGEAAHWPYYMYQPFDLPKSIFNFARQF